MVGGNVHKRSKFGRFLYDFKKNKALLLLTLPLVIFTFVFSYIPMFGIIIAFQDFRYDKGIFESSFNGLRNFEMFFTSPDSFRITRNTVGYNASFIILDLIFAVVIAFLLYEISSRKLLKLYQTLMFIPHFISWVVVAYMAYAFLSPQTGIITQLMNAAGANISVDFYTTPFYWIFVFPLANLWKHVGFAALIYYASLLSIDSEYMEAAAIEGANKWQVMTKIQLPFIYPLMTILTILAIGRIFNADFGLFYQLPMDSKLLYSTTDVIETYVFRALTVDGNISMASASNFYKSIVGFVLVLITNAVVKKINPENSLY